MARYRTFLFGVDTRRILSPPHEWDLPHFRRNRNYNRPRKTLCRRPAAPPVPARVRSTVSRGFFAASCSLKCGCRCLSAVVPKNELIEVNLELRLTHSVVGTDQPLLEISNGPIGKWDNRPRTFAQLRSEWLRAGDVLEPGLRETREAFETVRVNRGTGCDVLGKKP